MNFLALILTLSFLMISIKSSAIENSSCLLSINNAKNLIQVDGIPTDEENFLNLSKGALEECTHEAKKWHSLKRTLSNAKKACEEAGGQGMSSIFLSYCYLKAAELGLWVMNK